MQGIGIAIAKLSFITPRCDWLIANRSDIVCRERLKNRFRSDCFPNVGIRPCDKNCISHR
ncbi:Uncharacterised protein [Vibrio cholerae]|nr:Uncharacterised protein [Vibrio cholerae]CSI50146.1 Uncharacterised protein [Vibrio cholerae]CSI82851.1 Uncharacterised protein [Vibrio cholerae]